MSADRAARIREHPDAPRWNYHATDGLTPEDLPALDAMRRSLRTSEGPWRQQDAERWAEGLRARVGLFRRRWRPEWNEIEPCSREDLATRPERFVPEDIELTRMSVYRTAGTTGHALRVPHHPRAVAGYLPLIESALARHGASALVAALQTADVAGFLVAAQARTITYATTLSGWNGAGWAKLNTLDGFRDDDAARRFFRDLRPALLTGDPLSFAELLRLRVHEDTRPGALVSTSMALAPTFRDELARAFECPVIDLYSLTETGPIGYACPRGDGAFHVLPTDLFVELLDVDRDGRGEITVSGGRNPFVPLLRYRTGDFARIEHAPCPCGDRAPRIVELEGRAPVRLLARDGRSVNTVDVSAVLRRFALVQHSLVQRADGACELWVRPSPCAHFDREALVHALRAVLGFAVTVQVDPTLGMDGPRKVTPYQRLA